MLTFKRNQKQVFTVGFNGKHLFRMATQQKKLEYDKSLTLTATMLLILNSIKPSSSSNKERQLSAGKRSAHAH